MTNTEHRLTPDRHYVRVTFPMSWCRHDYESPRQIGRELAQRAGLEVMATALERGTVAVYAVEPSINDARAWDRYRGMACSSAQRVYSVPSQLRSAGE